MKELLKVVYTFQSCCKKHVYTVHILWITVFTYFSTDPFYHTLLVWYQLNCLSPTFIGYVSQISWANAFYPNFFSFIVPFGPDSLSVFELTLCIFISQNTTQHKHIHFQQLCALQKAHIKFVFM